MVEYITRLEGAKGSYEAKFVANEKLSEGDIIYLADNLFPQHNQKYTIEHVEHREHLNLAVVKRLPDEIYCYRVRG